MALISMSRSGRSRRQSSGPAKTRVHGRAAASRLCVLPATQLFTVEDGTIRRVAFDSSRFDYGRVTRRRHPGRSGILGFRLAFGQERTQLVSIFQGPSFYRALALGQNFGAIARGIILKPGDQRGEEVPQVRGYWLERPAPGSDTLVINALYDAESVTVAARMTLRPGEMTLIDHEITIFAGRRSIIWAWAA